MFSGKVSVFNRRLQLAHPAYELLRGRLRGRGDASSPGRALSSPSTPPPPSWSPGRSRKAIQTVLPSAREAGRPPAGLPARGPGPGLPPRGPPQDPPPAHHGRHRGRPGPSRSGRGLRPPGRPRPPPPRRRPNSPPFPGSPAPDGLLTAFDDRLPFTLTDGQQQGLPRDLRRPRHRPPDAPAAPGRGGHPARPWCALRAMLAVVDAGGQAAMLAPTEVLAQQHHRSVVEMMGELAEGGMLGGVRAGHQGGAAHRLDGRRRPRDRPCSTWPPARPGIVIGTHALIEDKVAVPRPRPGRRRRAAPLRRRAARRPARQGQAARRTCWS